MTEKKQLGVLLVLLVVLALLGWNTLSRRSLPRLSPRRASNTAPAQAAAGQGSQPILDAVLHVGQLVSPPRVQAAEVRRNIFAYARRAAPAVTRVRPAAAPPALPPPPQPQLPLRFFGFAQNRPSGQRRVFLTDGEEIFVAVEGDVILRRYRLVRVRNESIEMEELTGTRRWVLALEQP
ncbi:MAG: hypothetical protein ACE5HL_01860 [Terriglobia bacterium]